MSCKKIKHNRIREENLALYLRGKVLFKQEFLWKNFKFGFSKRIMIFIMALLINFIVRNIISKVSFLQRSNFKHLCTILPDWRYYLKLKIRESIIIYFKLWTISKTYFVQLIAAAKKLCSNPVPFYHSQLSTCKSWTRCSIKTQVYRVIWALSLSLDYYKLKRISMEHKNWI